MEERDLVRRCLAWESRAWDALVHRYAPAVSARIAAVYRSRLGRRPTPAEATELLQDVFVRLAEEDARILRNFRWEASLATYLSVVAASSALNRLKRDAGDRLARAPRLDLLNSSDFPDARAASPEEQALLKEASESLRHLVEDLPERERLIARMYFWEEVPSARIAELLGISQRSVQMILGQTLDSLRRRM